MVILTALAIVGITLVQKSDLHRQVGEELDFMARDEARKITQNVFLMCRAMQESVQQSVDQGLRIAEDILSRNGGFHFAEERVTWNAVNQYTQESRVVDLPKMMVGDLWLGQNLRMTAPSPIVDEIKTLSGVTATIFQRINEQGDMLRVTTNVEKLDGTRAIGTYLPHTNPDGSENPVIKAVLKGETFRGRAFVVDAWYITAYQPIWDERREQVIGILYVGEKQENVASLREGIMDVVVGKTGYVYVLGGTGEERGRYILSKGGARDGQDLWEATDADGSYFAQAMVNKALALADADDGKGIPVDFQRYRGHGKSEAESRWREAAISYFAPWDWVIVADYSPDDFVDSQLRVTAALEKMVDWILLFAACVVLIAIVIAFYLARTITGPLEKTVQMVSELERGHLDMRLNMEGHDEVCQMAQSMDAFADSLEHEVVEALSRLANGDLTFKIAPRDEKDVVRGALNKLAGDLNTIIAHIQVSGEQLTSSSLQVADTSQALSKGATDQASSLEEIASSMNEVASQTRQSALNASEANLLTDEAKGAAGRGTAHMQAMVTAMGEINEAGQNISTIIKVIDEIAFQTNLLALNAAVEAARAGVHGKGFAVVAEEVRNLAARSAKAAKETEALIAGSVEKAERGARIADTTAEVLHEIVSSVGKVSELVSEIAAASNEQALGISLVNQGLEQIEQVTQQNTANAEESAAASELLSGQAIQLQQMLKRFTLGKQHRSRVESGEPKLARLNWSQKN